MKQKSVNDSHQKVRPCDGSEIEMACGRDMTPAGAELYTCCWHRDHFSLLYISPETGNCALLQVCDQEDQVKSCPEGAFSTGMPEVGFVGFSRLRYITAQCLLTFMKNTTIILNVVLTKEH